MHGPRYPKQHVSAPAVKQLKYFPQGGKGEGEIFFSKGGRARETELEKQTEGEKEKERER